MLFVAFVFVHYRHRVIVKLLFREIVQVAQNFMLATLMSRNTLVFHQQLLIKNPLKVTSYHSKKW